MATQGIEQVTEDAIRAVARDCGSLSMECSDVAGYVQGVAERINDHMQTLDTLEEVTTRLLADQARVSDSTDEARLLSEQAKSKLEAGRDAIDDTIVGFKGLTELGVDVPGQVSVVGFDNTLPAELVGLTTVATPVTLLGETAGRHVISMVTAHVEAQEERRSGRRERPYRSCYHRRLDDRRGRRHSQQAHDDALRSLLAEL